jgi:hypothetical protein
MRLPHRYSGALVQETRHGGSPHTLPPLLPSAVYSPADAVQAVLAAVPLATFRCVDEVIKISSKATGAAWWVGTLYS